MAGEPATKQDLATLEAKLDAKFNAMLERVQEIVRDAQTEILRGFEAFARENEIRVRRLETNESGTNERLANLEARLLEIEKKLLLRPPAA